MPTTRQVTQAMKRTLRSNSNNQATSTRKLRERPMNDTTLKSSKNTAPSKKKKKIETPSTKATSTKKRNIPISKKGRQNGTVTRKSNCRITRSHRALPVYLPVPSEVARSGGRPKRTAQNRDSSLKIITRSRTTQKPARGRIINGGMVLRSRKESNPLGVQPSHRQEANRNSERMRGSGRGRLTAQLPTPNPVPCGVPRHPRNMSIAPPVKKARIDDFRALRAPPYHEQPSVHLLTGQEEAVVNQVNRPNPWRAINMSELVHNFAHFSLEDFVRKQMIVEVGNYPLGEQEINEMIGRFAEFSLGDRAMHRVQPNNVILFVEIADGTIKQEE